MVAVMDKRFQSVALAVLALALSTGSAATSQVEPWDQKFNRGQSVVPVYEGWERNRDGSVTMVFGYMNRNYVEQVYVPIGPGNSFGPNGPDRGQPEHFLPRRSYFVFRVDVPKDWGDKELIWTLTANGKTEKAYGSLLATWEIDRLIRVSNDGGGGGADNGTIEKNQPPTIAIAPVRPVTVSERLTLTATITDDGIPKPTPRRKAAIGQETPPTLKFQGEPSPVNVPLPVATKPPLGLSVGWSVYRGPGTVTFEPGGYSSVKDSKVVTAAAFSAPGKYVLRAIANDGMLKTPADVTVVVTGRLPSESQPSRLTAVWTEVSGRCCSASNSFRSW
jgi:hypothetical protein